jgi:hypothetical protein
MGWGGDSKWVRRSGALAGLRRGWGVVVRGGGDGGAWSPPGIRLGIAAGSGGWPGCAGAASQSRERRRRWRATPRGGAGSTNQIPSGWSCGAVEFCFGESAGSREGNGKKHLEGISGAQIEAEAPNLAGPGRWPPAAEVQTHGDGPVGLNRRNLTRIEPSPRVLDREIRIAAKVWSNIPSGLGVGK